MYISQGNGLNSHMCSRNNIQNLLSEFCKTEICLCWVCYDTEVQYLNLFSQCLIYKICKVCMNLNTLSVVSTSLYSKCSCWPAQSHTELWSSSMHFNFCIVHINERTSRFCIFTNCFKMAVVSCFMGPSNNVFQSNFWNSYFAQNYQ